MKSKTFPQHIRYVKSGWRKAAATGDPFALADSHWQILVGRFFWSVFLLIFLALVAAIGVAFYEIKTGAVSARYFAPWAREMQFRLGPGPSPRIVFPKHGPFDERRGYTQLPTLRNRLEKKGFTLVDQARFTPALMRSVQQGFYPTYAEKNRAGLRLLDREGLSLYEVRYPQLGYLHFDSIPAPITAALLFIENRNLLDSVHLSLNPAIEWGRFGRAVFDYGRKSLGQDVDVSGGSTLATQMEKYRHSRNGVTSKPEDKVLQMVSAMLRAYRDGPNTLPARRQILLDYVNSVPLAALPGYGEVNGLGDGLLAWYGASLDSVNARLRKTYLPADSNQGLDSVNAVALDSAGADFRRVLNLFIAHRRPSAYLLNYRDALDTLGDSHLRLMAQSGWVDSNLAMAALKARPPLLRRAAVFQPVDFIERKAVNGVRARLLDVFGFPRLYDLDRLDLTVTTTLDHSTQTHVSEVLRKLADTAFVTASGLKAFRLLEKGDPGKVIYSFTLYERVGDFNLLRIQADNLDQPFSINDGVKLDLGSTAKLRTLVHYLEVIAALHARHATLNPAKLKQAAEGGEDALTRWSAEWLLKAEDTTLTAALNAALDRQYSASPREKFFTGGGLHTFVNFNSADDRKSVTVREAMRHSINLPFIRMMREIVQYHAGLSRVDTSDTLAGESALVGEDLERQRLLAQFAEKEGLQFLGGFYRRFRDRDSLPPRELLFHSLRHSVKRMAAAWKYLAPAAPADSFVAIARRALGDEDYPRKSLESALNGVGDVSRYTLADWGYLTGVHPLELWLTGYLTAKPKAVWSEVREKSKEQIQVTYQWLFRTRYRSAQDIRIRTVVESEAFLEIHKAWKRLGYPFPSLVPSLATSIGSSADRPAALAELMGIIQNDGVRRPAIAVKRLHFGEGSPYETVFVRTDSTAERVLAPEICQVLKGTLIDVVENGSAVRGRGAFELPGNTWIPLGGKTGTGDQRYETTDKRGRVIESRVVNRTASFAFILGERFYGVLTAHVQGEQAAKFGFTSSLPVAILKVLAPSLMPLISAPAAEATANLYAAYPPSAGMVDTTYAMPWRP